MSEENELFFVCDDTNNIDFQEIDMSSIPSEVLAELDAIFSGEDSEFAAV